MRRRALEAAFQMEGAFNEASLTLAPGADQEEVVRQADRLTDEYGSTGAYGRNEQASHKFVSNELIEEQRVWIIADIMTPPAERSTLGDGFRVEASIVTWDSEDELKVPADALFRRGSEWAVYVARQSRAVLQIVQVGHTNGIEAEILNGLTAGDHVILHPSDRVHLGVRITAR